LLNKFIFFCLILSHAASGLCEFSRNKQVKNIYLIGISHDPGLAGKFMRISKTYLSNVIKYKYANKKSKITLANKKFDARFKKLLLVAHRVSKDNRYSLIHIKKVLKKKKIDYIGLEYTEKSLNKILKSLTTGYYFIRKLINVRHQSTKSKKEIAKIIDDLFLFVYGPVIYLYFKQKIKNTKLIGIEDTKTKAAALKVNARYKSIVKKIPEGGQGFRRLMQYNTMKLFKTKKMPLPGEISNLVRIHNNKSINKTSLHKLIQSNFKFFLIFHKVVIKNRDISISKNITKINQNALIVIGDAHTIGIKNNLDNSNKNYKVIIKSHSNLNFINRTKITK